MLISVIVPVEITKGTSSGKRMTRISAASIFNPAKIGATCIGHSIREYK
jgi:hypothetical protein